MPWGSCPVCGGSVTECDRNGEKKSPLSPSPQRRQNLHTSGTNPTETAKNSNTSISPSLQ
jgi:hypothetical protein